MKRIFFMASFGLALAFSSNAQGFEQGKFVGGPTLLVNSHLGLGAALTGEYAAGLILDNVGIGGDIGFSRYTETYKSLPYYFGLDWYKFIYTNIFIAPTISYHLKLNNKFDPYGRIGISVAYWITKYKDSKGATTEPNIGSIVGEYNNIEARPVIIAGMRYWFKDNTAFRAEVGYPNLIAIGLDFGLN